jgi:ketosteroid isomerase-like protein
MNELTRLMAEQERRLKAVEDERSILDTIYQYCHTLDFGLIDEWMDCFTEDAVWFASIDGPWAGAGGARHTGRKEIEAWVQGMRSKGEGPHAKGKHYLIGPDIRVDGDRATAESYHLGVGASPTGTKPNSMGRYLDVLVRCPDGRWRIKERHLAKEGASVEAQSRIVGGKH